MSVSYTHLEKTALKKKRKQLKELEEHRDKLQEYDNRLNTLQDRNSCLLYTSGKYETESSGGITFDTLRDYAECGVDFISVGALTHSVKGLDMSFKAC